MASNYDKRGPTLKVNVGNEFGGHHGGTDAHLSNSSQGLGQTVGGAGLGGAGATHAGGVHTGAQTGGTGYGGWRLSGGCMCLLAVIFAFIFLFIFWYLIFNCVGWSWCCDKKSGKKDCCRVLWAAMIAAFISLIVLWFICWACGRC